MRLYPKKLRGIEDLEREKKILLGQSQQLEKEDILSLEGLTTGKKKKKDKKEDDDTSESSIIDLLPISNPFVKVGLKFLLRRITERRPAPPKDKSAPVAAYTAPIVNKAKAIALEFIGGYLKWKAIELSYKGIQYMVNSHKERKAQEERERRYVRFKEQRMPRK